MTIQLENLHVYIIMKRNQIFQLLKLNVKFLKRSSPPSQKNSNVNSKQNFKNLNKCTKRNVYEVNTDIFKN